MIALVLDHLLFAGVVAWAVVCIFLALCAVVDAANVRRLRRHGITSAQRQRQIDRFIDGGE